MAPLAATWPAPSALQGVKSRKKAFFKADKATVTVDNGSSWAVSSISVCLESRIAAVGEGARAVSELMLGTRQLNVGAATSHPALVVAHLGPHLAGRTADADQHISAVATALQQQPHAVILDEALPHGGAGWARAFQQIVRDPALSSFKGAVVVVCGCEATFAVRRICSEQWVGACDKVMQQDTAGQRLQIVENAVKATSSDAEGQTAGKKPRGKKQTNSAGDYNEALVGETRTLSEYLFEEDVVSLARKKGWTVALLTEDANDGCGTLRGYLCYRYVATTAGRELHIERLATPRQFRGRGFARVLMKWILGEAARMPRSDCTQITCSAFEGVVKFYELFGFAVNPDRRPVIKDDEDPQTFMELCNASLVLEE